MPNLLKHVLVLGLALPTSLLGYHLYAGAHGSDGEVTRNALGDAFSGLSLGGGDDEYQLSKLAIFRKDMWHVEAYYVEQERLDPDAMFQAALERAEREIPELLFERQPAGRRLSVSVGSFTTVLLLEPVTDFVSFNTQLSRVARVLEDHLSAEVDQREVEYALVAGALSTLDPHTILMPPEAAREMEVDNEDEFGGLGIEITVIDGQLTIKNPMEGTPAARVGLLTDDQIVRIEDESTLNMDLQEAVALLRGPVGAPVSIAVMRKGFDVPRTFTIVRDIIRVKPVTGELLPGGIAYVRIQSFHDNVSADLAGLLAGFRAKSGEPPNGLILDLRGNPGGYLNRAVDVANFFLTSGVIVSTVEGGTRNRREPRKASAMNTEPDYPVAVLVNGSSASASEIVAGALRNLDRAVIIGERTFGKGSVQHLYDNPDDSRLKLTVAQYLTPGDESIQSVGISPDILLQPSLVAPADPGEDGRAGQPRVSLYGREWVTRERDLDHHLETTSDREQPPAYAVRYLLAADDLEDRDTRPTSDWEVGFARDVLSVARSPRRADIIQAAASVVERRRAEESGRLLNAFGDIGIDWRSGVNTAPPELSIRVDVGDDGVLQAGEREDLAIEVTNLGTEALTQLAAVTSSGNPWLNHREFYFGALNPGETRSVAQELRLADGHPTELTPMTVELRSGDAGVLLTESALVRLEGRALPRFSWSVALVEDGSGESRGDGDGLPEMGEIVELAVTVTNIGEGAAREPFVRLKNRSGKSVDLRVGSADPGVRRTPDGASCSEQGQDCLPSLNPGESADVRLSFELRGEPDESGGWDVELQVGDHRAYDYGSVHSGGFTSAFQLTEDLHLVGGQPLPSAERRPPVIALSRRPDVLAGTPDAVISGVVSDDHGVRDVMVFFEDDKLAYQGGGEGARSLPVTAEARMATGPNHFYVLARDVDGLTASVSLSALVESASDPEAQAAVSGTGSSEL